MNTQPVPAWVAADPELELSLEDLEMVVGGLERVFVRPEPLAFGASGSAQRPAGAVRYPAPAVPEIRVASMALQF